MIFRSLLMLSLFVAPALAVEADQARTLFQFAEEEAAEQWGTVNDGVMGGRSVGRFAITEEQRLRFYGNLSLENNGGFASVRSRSAELQLAPGDTLTLRVKGDGRKYTMNLYTPVRRIAFSYRASFQTVQDEWVEVSIPVEDFVATSFGRVVRNSPLDPTRVNRVGIVLGDKKAGPFELEVDWIKVSQASVETLESQATAERWREFLDLK